MLLGKEEKLKDCREIIKDIANSLKAMTDDILKSQIKKTEEKNLEKNLEKVKL